MTIANSDFEAKVLVGLSEIFEAYDGAYDGKLRLADITKDERAAWYGIMKQLVEQKIIKSCTVTDKDSATVTEKHLQDDIDLYYQIDEVDRKKFEEYFSSKVTAEQETKYATTVKNPIGRAAARSLVNIIRNKSDPLCDISHIGWSVVLDERRNEVVKDHCRSLDPEGSEKFEATLSRNNIGDYGVKIGISTYRIPATSRDDALTEEIVNTIWKNNWLDREVFRQELTNSGITFSKSRKSLVEIFRNSPLTGVLGDFAEISSKKILIRSHAVLSKESVAKLNKYKI